MKKFKMLSTALAAGLALSFCAFGAAGCTRDQGEEVDPTRTQIFINYYNGGLGAEWITALKEAYEDEHPEIQIMPIPGKTTMDSGTVLNNFDTYDGDLFFMDYVGSADLNSFRNNGLIADITEYVQTEDIAYDEGTQTIWDKITPSVKDYYDMDGKVYALPWYQASYQIIYDIQLFEDNSYYKDAEGNWNDGSSKSVGQDGEAGTYDDGLPETYSDFFALMDKMVEDGLIPMTWFGSQAYYFTSMLTNLFADYEGYNDFLLNYKLEGTDSDLGAVTLEDAYRLKNGQSGKRYALEFAQKIATNSSYYSGNTFQTSQDNFTAQDEMLQSVEISKDDPDRPRVAMLVDGPWWEREASATMNDMASYYENEYYAYGTREFGIMPMPEADDGSSAEGNTIACTSGRSLIFMNNSSEVKDEAADFLQFCMSEEGLRIATAKSGVMRPYEYTMTQEYLDQMTPFGRMVYDYNHSAEIVFEELPLHDFLETEGAAYCSYLYTWVSTEDTLANVAQYFMLPENNPSVDAYISGLAIDAGEWTTAAEEYIFRTESAAETGSLS